MRGMIKVWMFQFIRGVMFGLEWDYEEGYVMVDLGIVRVIYDYRGFN